MDILTGKRAYLGATILDATSSINNFTSNLRGVFEK